jgi:hypothetical protein
MYATVGQKTWRNSDEVVTKLGLLAVSSVAAVLFVSCILLAKMVWLSSP